MIVVQEEPVMHLGIHRLTSGAVFVSAFCTAWLVVAPARSMDPEPKVDAAHQTPQAVAPPGSDESSSSNESAADVSTAAPVSQARPAASPQDDKPGPDDKPAEAPIRPTLDPATLDGVQPGRTTRDQLHQQWGKPLSFIRIAGGSRETFHLAKLGRVRATVTENVVHSLVVRVENPIALSIVVSRLAIDDVEPVNVYDERGELLGAAYPQRGVLLGYVPRTQPPRVFQIVIEPLDAQPFLARAEARMATRYADCLADVRQALELSPDNVRAYGMLAEVALRAGDLDVALRSAQKAIELAPDEPAHRLLVACVLAASGDYQQAIARVRDVIAEPNVPDIVAARARTLWGDYLARSARCDYAGAIKQHQHAIKLAEPLAAHNLYAVRRAAKEILVDAHLGVAYTIGWGRWQQKSTMAMKWIDRATSIADELVAHERAGPEMHLRIYTGALAALAGMAEPPDAEKYIRGVGQVGKRMYDEAVDGGYRARLAWQMAEALSDAVEIERARHQPERALALGDTSRTLFDESQAMAGRLPTYNYQRGRLCYRLGTVYAVEKADHVQAVTWFDEASPLLEKPVPAAAVDAATQGEAFVSMAVSYWELDNRSEALRLTRQGLKLMEQAVSEGLLDSTALAIPYSNMASMNKALGDIEAAKKYSALAARYEAEAAAK
jgi:tetratricopeptide (TPR) repeat protein